VTRVGIERNRCGEEEPHSDAPELWNIDGVEVDLNAKYKIGGQMWYLQSRATDAIKKALPIAGTPMNAGARDADRLFGEQTAVASRAGSTGSSAASGSGSDDDGPQFFG
jgi:hypothetical protein